MTDIQILGMTDIDESVPSTEWLAEWLARPAFGPNRHSVVLGSRCGTNLKRLGALVSGYLNENDPEPLNHWHAFSTENMWLFAGDPLYRDLILAGQAPDVHFGPPDSDIDRIARRLARLGGAVLEGDFSLDATNDLENVFRVGLCSHRPVCLDSCHILLNPQRFSHHALVLAIGDSFLDWTSRNPVISALRHAT